MHTNTSSVTVFIQRSCNEIFITQVTGLLCRQLSIMVASSRVVMLRCYGLWREECMHCVGWTVQSLAEQPVVGLIQQLLKSKSSRSDEHEQYSRDAYSVAGTRRLVWSPSPWRSLSTRARCTSASTPLLLCRRRSYRGAVGRAGHTATARCRW